MKILCVFGEHNYGDPSRGQGYEYSNFLPALKRLGHQTVFFESFNRERFRNFSELNYNFLQTVQNEKPDCILCVLMGYELWLETLELVRRNCDCTLINWSTDDSWKYEQFSRYIANNFHIYATTYQDAVTKSLRDGYDNFFLTQWAADAAKLTPPLPAKECKFDVSFIGSKYGRRETWIRELKQRNIEVTCFGHGWENGPVEADAIPKIMQESVISLNFSDSSTVIKKKSSQNKQQIKARTFEVPGAGGFLLSEQAENLSNFYTPDREVVIFENINELTDKIAYFLSHPEQRDSIAKAGYTRTKQHHTYDIRFSQILARASLLRQSSSITSSRKSCIINETIFSQLRQRHHPGLLLHIFKQLLLMPCMLLWGQQRGPRAARRILFEISWRLLGKQTYSAAGLPGRLFYKES